MRDLVVREGLEAMAFDAADRLRGLIAAGEDIPYDVHEPGDGSPLCRYEPQTEIFIRDHAGELRDLDSFGACCAAIETRGLATGYLEELGIGVPRDPRPRAELAGLVFLCRLWMGSSDFSIEHERLDVVIEELEAGLAVDAGEIEVIVPLRGLQMPVARLDLAVASIVRADTVDVPAEARLSDGLGISPWETPCLAAIRVSDHAPDDLGEVVDAGFSAVDSFRRLITTLRLFKAGGVGLGPHAWTRMAGDRWRRIATGSGRHRPGGYRLTEDELAELAAFSRALSSAGTPFARLADDRPGFPVTLGRALNRFEAGLERNVVIEALNDYLLALRFVLEGGGPADLGLAMRVAALCAEPERRTEVKAVVDRAAGLERELWSGEPAPGSPAVTPAETAAALEELARAILKDAAVGHLGSDLRVTADEILLADGLAVGDGAAEQRGGTTEWDLEPIEVTDAADPEGEGQLGLEEELERLLPQAEAAPEPEPEEVSELDGRISPEDGPEPEEEIMFERAREIFGHRVDEEPTTSLELVPPSEPGGDVAHDEHDEGYEPDEDYGAESHRLVDDDGRPRPASPVLRLIERTRAEREARNNRVAGLFPPPETTEWTVREIAYDRSRRAHLTP